MMELALVVPEAERRDSRKSRRPHSIATIFRDSPTLRRVAQLNFAVVDSSDSPWGEVHGGIVGVKFLSFSER